MPGNCLVQMIEIINGDPRAVFRFVPRKAVDEIDIIQTREPIVIPFAHRFLSIHSTVTTNRRSFGGWKMTVTVPASLPPGILRATTTFQSTTQPAQGHAAFGAPEISLPPKILGACLVSGQCPKNLMAARTTTPTAIKPPSLIVMRNSIALASARIAASSAFMSARIDPLLRGAYRAQGEHNIGPRKRKSRHIAAISKSAGFPAAA